MQCPVCGGVMEAGKTSLTLERSGDRIIVIKNVPALVCTQCGENFIDISVSKQVEKIVLSAEKSGIKLGFLEFDQAA